MGWSWQGPGRAKAWGGEWNGKPVQRGAALHRRALVALCEEFRHRRDLVALGVVGGRPARDRWEEATG